MSALIAARALEFGPKDAPVLRDVSIEIAAGEIVTLVGPNGSGKSTLLRLLIGALAPRRGTVRRARGLRIGYVPQSLVLDASLPITVRRFLDLPLRVGDAEAEAALEQSGAGGIADRQMAALSGGAVPEGAAGARGAEPAAASDPRRADPRPRPARPGRLLQAHRDAAARDGLCCADGQP